MVGKENVLLRKLRKKVGKILRGNVFCGFVLDLRDNDFRNYIKNYNANRKDIIRICHFGIERPNEFIYCIKNRGNAGFCSELVVTLQCLRFAEIFHLIPVVCWDKSGLYVEKKPLDGNENSFEYFFEPVSDILSKDIQRYKNVIFSMPDHRFNTNLLDGGNEFKDNLLNVRNLGSLYQKYCKLNLKTQEYIDENLKEKLCGKKTLGVHIRGTDYRQGFSYHPVYISAQNFVEPTKKILKKYKYEQIFLATDSLSAIALFQKEFEGKLVFYEDIKRSDGDVGVHYLKSDREHHQYLLGLEVLRDAYTLSACDSLIAGISNVSLAAQYIKVSCNSTYEDVVIIDHGFHGKRN